MRHFVTVMLACAAVSVTAAAQTPAVNTPTKPADPLHAWVGLTTPAQLDNWTQWHIMEARKQIAALKAVQGAHTVANTLKPYDAAQLHLSLAGHQVGLMFATSPEKSIRDGAQNLVQTVAAEGVTIQLDQDVYNALKATDVSGADAATKYYLQRTLLEYKLAGVDKDEATRKRVKELQDLQTKYTTEFGRNVQDDVRKITVKSGDLDGLPADYIASHKPDAQGNVTITTDSPDFRPVMSYAKDAAVRREMLLAYDRRAYPANEKVLLQLLQTRQDLAHTLGYKTWADLATADQMMGSATNMKQFLDEVAATTKPVSEKEFALLEEFVRGKDASALPLTAADSGYWGELYRRAKYDFDSQSVRKYFPYDQVEAGVLSTAAALFHIEFKRAPDAPVWDPSVTAYDVYDGGKKAGRIYLDMHPREGKDKWFNEDALVPGQLGVELPEARLVCNFPGGKPGEPGLMQYGDVVTFFHEFGHMMHEVLGGRQQWAGQAGVSTEGDFVEAPSQMLEEFFTDTKILQRFAKDYKTGEVIPAETVARMTRASKYGRGSSWRMQVGLSTYALEVHDYATGEPDLQKLQNEMFARFSNYKELPDDHFFAAFTHLAGYTSNYYTYTLDKVIALDFFAQFDQKDLLNGPTAMRYRRAVLEPGGSKPAADLVKDFLGRPQNMDAFRAWISQEFTAGN